MHIIHRPARQGHYAMQSVSVTRGSKWKTRKPYYFRAKCLRMALTNDEHQTEQTSRKNGRRHPTVLQVSTGPLAVSVSFSVLWSLEVFDSLCLLRFSPQSSNPVVRLSDRLVFQFRKGFGCDAFFFSRL